MEIVTEYRLNGLVIRKRFADGMCDASSLLNQYNESAETQKRADMFMRNGATRALILELKNEPTVTPVETERADGKRTVWFCPQLFFLFACWLSPECGSAVGKCLFGGVCEPTDVDGGYKRLSESLGIDAQQTDKMVTAFERVAGVMPKTKPDDGQNAEIKALQNHMLNIVETKSCGYDDVMKEFGVLYNTKFNI